MFHTLSTDYRCAFASLAFVTIIPALAGSATIAPRIAGSNPVAISISPTNKTTRCLESISFVARTSNASNAQVLWSVNGVVGGNPTVGTIDSGGKYTAPGALPPNPVVVTATTVANPASSASTTVTLENGIPIVTSATSPVLAGSSVSIVVRGSSFAKNATLTLDKVPLAFTWISSSQLTVETTVPMTTTGFAALKVTNPDPGAAVSNQYQIQLSQPSGTPRLSVDAGSNRHPISPDIYGIAFGPGITGPNVELAKQIRLPNVRWGGDAASNYNWQTDVSNTGSDHNFVNFFNGGGTFVTPAFRPDQMIKTYKSAIADLHPLITIPIIPWISNSSATACSYPSSEVGVQQGVVSWAGQTCGNGETTGGFAIPDSNFALDYVPNSPTIQEGWVQHLIASFGKALDGGVAFYQLDNEPSAWHGVHRDVEPVQPDYSTIVSLGQEYAAMVKAQDSTAKVLGPSDYTEYGWTWYAPAGSPLYAGQYYLQQMASYAADHGGKRFLDYFDEHWACPDMSSAAAELNSTRTLWDPAFNAGSSFERYLDGPVMMLPRFKNWIETYYPGTDISVSEYECVAKPGSPTIIDALAEVEILGVFGNQGVMLANNFNVPKAGDPLSFAYLLYRNYDGQGSQFGDTSIASVSTVPASLSVYGAIRSSDGKLTVMAVNRTASAIATSLTINNFESALTAAVYTYSAENVSQIQPGEPVSLDGPIVKYTFPPYSATLFIFDQQ